MKNLLYPELIGEMAKHGDTQRSIAKLLGLSHLTVCRRFAGKSEWTINEVDILCKRYQKNYYELFKKNYKNN